MSWLHFVMFFTGTLVGFLVKHRDWWMIPVFFTVMFVQFWAIYYIENRTQKGLKKGTL